MDYFTDNAAPRAALMSFLMSNGAALDAEIRDKLAELNSTPSIVDLVVNVGEYLYAKRADVPNAGKVLGAQMAAFRAANDWHREADTGNARAQAIQYALMRATNQTAPPGVTYQAAADDPAVLPAFAPPPPPPAPITPPEE